MRRRSNSTAFQSVTPFFPRIAGVNAYESFIRYREIPDLTPFVPPEDVCTIDDPLNSITNYNALPDFITITQVDQYGLLGFEEQRNASDTQSVLNWTICPNIDYCDGPTQEGVTQARRYFNRWVASYDPDTGIISYGRTDQSLIPADVLLFPTPLTLTEDDQISISFDGNAKASFAIQLNATTVEIRRLVAGVPSITSFPGTAPRLFYNGIVQRDSASIDLVCFYLNAGAVCARFQRDNFLTEYALYTPAIAPVRITKTDRSTAYQRLYFIDIDGVYRTIRSEPYPPFPVFEDDSAMHLAVPAGGEYDSLTVISGPYSDSGIHMAVPAGGEYDSNTVISGPYAEAATHNVVPAGGEYNLIAVSGGTYSESASHNAIPGTGEYNLVAISGGTYTDDSQHQASPAGGEYS